MPEKRKFMFTNLYRDVYGNFIHNSPNWEQPRCPPVNEWLNRLGDIHKQTGGHPHRGKVLDDHKKGTTHVHNNLDDSLENHAELEKPTPEGYIVHDSIYITFLK